jgi:hypothetical protein
MVETIAPVVSGGRARWLGSLALHAIGAALTASLFGAALGFVGRLLSAPWQRPGLLVLAVVAGLYGLAEATRLRMPVPQLRRQVPVWWRTFFGRRVAAGLYGAGLGVGFLTYLAHGTLVVVALAAVVAGRPLGGALLLLPFGAVRGLSTVVAWRSVTQERSRALIDRLVAGPESHRRVANGAALAMVAIAAAAGASRAPAGRWWVLGAASLAAVFAWASVSKIVGVHGWRDTLAALDLPPALTLAAVRAVPAAEAVVPALFVAGLPRAAGGYAAALMLAFSLALFRARRFGNRIPCGCFGARGGAIRIRTALARNAALMTLAALVLARGSDAAAVEWPGIPHAGDALPSMLTIGSLVVGALAAWRASVWLERGRRG